MIDLTTLTHSMQFHHVGYVLVCGAIYYLQCMACDFNKSKRLRKVIRNDARYRDSRTEKAGKQCRG